MQNRERSPRASKPVFLDAEDDEADETAGTHDEGNAVHEEIVRKLLAGMRFRVRVLMFQFVFDYFLLLLKIAHSFLENGPKQWAERESYR